MAISDIQTNGASQGTFLVVLASTPKKPLFGFKSTNTLDVLVLIDRWSILTWEHSHTKHRSMVLLIILILQLMPLPVVPLINAGASIFEQGFNAFLTGQNNRKSRQWNEKMYAQTRADSLADWNMQNEYNSPRAQMQRLRDANLNPNLVYGHGAATQTATAPRSPNLESWNPQAPQVNSSGMAASLMSHFDIKLKEASIDNLAAQNSVAVQDALLKAAQVLSTTTTAKSTAFDLSMKEALKETSLEAAKVSLEKLKSDTDVSLTQAEIARASKSSSIAKAAQEVINMRISGKQAQEATSSIQRDIRLKDLDIALKEKGIMPGDPMWARILARVLERYISPDGSIQLPTPWRNVPKDTTPKQDSSWNRMADSLGFKHLRLKPRSKK